MDQELDQGIDLKSIFFYCIKRWFVFVLIAVLCAAGAGIYAILFEEKAVRVQASAYLCDINAYADTVPGRSNEIIIESYHNHIARAVDAMVSADNAMLFLEDAGYKEMLTQLSVISKKKPLQFLREDVRVGWQTSKVFVICEIDDPKKVEDIKTLLDAYLEFLISRAYGASSMFAEVDANGGEAVTVFAAQHIGTTITKKSFLSTALTGGMAGALAAAVLVVLWYYIDPKIKSINELTRFGFPVLKQIQDNQFVEEDLVYLTVKFKDEKRVCVVEPDGAQIGSFCRKLTEVWQEAGKKILWIDGNSTGGKFNDYLYGAGLTASISLKEGIPALVFSASSDWMYLESKKERLTALYTLYDKIIFSCNADETDALAVISGQCDSAVCILDKKLAKTKNIRKVCERMSESVKKVGSVVYGCKE